jgi:23S rRNA pseudouridine2457 synthase
MKFRYFLLNKPYGYLCQFTGEPGEKLLGELYDFPKDVYSVGRLDKDSEGLLLLTNDNRLKTNLLDPESKKEKTYWVQVEGDITSDAIIKLQSGTIEISHNGKKHRVEKAHCKKIDPPNIPERTPPIRYRASIPTSWIEITITEGKNRQVRKMTAAVGFPTLRLIRYSFGKHTLGNLQPGEVIEIQYT